MAHSTSREGRRSRKQRTTLRWLECLGAALRGWRIAQRFFKLSERRRAAGQALRADGGYDGC